MNLCNIDLIMKEDSLYISDLITFIVMYVYVLLDHVNKLHDRCREERERADERFNRLLSERQESSNTLNAKSPLTRC